MLRAQNTVWTTSLDTLSVFSSPRAANLNGDATLDLVIGGGIEDSLTPYGVFALDGLSGDLLWQLPTRDQVFGSALFKDLNGDGLDDVFICGRDAQFYALDGSNGSIIWEFWPDSTGSARAAGWFNFYTPAWVPDQNGDGFPDLVNSNGGDPTKTGNDTLRPPGYLLLMSGRDGSILAMDTVPDRRETYLSPLVLDPLNNGNLYILYGSGGETIGGHLYMVPLSELAAGDISQSETLLSDPEKGFIAVPSLADLNNDQIYDLIVPRMSGKLTALDGQQHQILWEVSKNQTENYVSPVIGQFTGDPSPDVYSLFAEGRWPFYGRFFEVMIDGQSGQVVWMDSSSTYQLASPNALDWDGDNFDEILLIDNFDDGFQTIEYRNRFLIRDFNQASESQWLSTRPGLNVFNTPLITDLDENGKLDLVFTWSPVTDAWYQSERVKLQRISLSQDAESIAWGGYFGTYQDGSYRENLPISLVEAHSALNIQAYPNPSREYVTFSGIPPGSFQEISIKDLSGKILQTFTENRISLGALPAGLYLWTLVYKGGQASGRINKVR